MCDTKLYGYTYGNSTLAAQRPLSEQQVMDAIARSIKHGVDPHKYQVYELVPVKVSTKITTIVTLER